jgi:iron complex outermembrane receptor protein
MNHDGFGENTFNGQPVSDKQINAARLNLGAYAGDDFDVQFALDWIDDQSGMRGSKMLAPNPFLRAYRRWTAAMTSARACATSTTWRPRAPRPR